MTLNYLATSKNYEWIPSAPYLSVFGIHSFNASDRVSNPGGPYIWVACGQAAQIFDHDFKTASIQPAPHLRIDHWPRRQSMRHDPLLVANLHDRAQPVEYRTQRMPALCCILAAQRQVRHHK
jgi:hypothetical protein